MHEHMSQFSHSSLRSVKSFVLILCLKLFRLHFLRSEGLNFPYRRGPKKKNQVTKTRDVEVSISEVVSFSNFVEIVLICSEVLGRF